MAFGTALTPKPFGVISDRSPVYSVKFAGSLREKWLRQVKLLNRN
jgi:hypothetical protein